MFKVFYWSNLILGIFSFTTFWNIKENFKGSPCSFNGKNFVNFVYGLTFGIGCVYFAPVANIIFLYMFFREYLCKCPYIPVIEE